MKDDEKTEPKINLIKISNALSKKKANEKTEKKNKK